MDSVLCDLKNGEVFVYIDDILIATDSMGRHYEVLKLVIEALLEANLRLKPQKCVLLEDQVTFLGHKDGVHTDPDKVVKIKEFPKPSNLAELRTFNCVYVATLESLYTTFRRYLHHYMNLRV